MKRQYKWFLTLMLILSVGLFTGCSAAGNGYFQLAEEVSRLDGYTFTGSAVMDMDMSDLGLSDEEAAILQNMEMEYSGEYNLEASALYFNMTMTMGDARFPMECYLDGSQMLISSDSLLEMMEVLGAEQEDIDGTAYALDGKKWLALDNAGELMAPILGEGGLAALSTNFYDALSYFQEHSFRDYDPGCFSGSSAKGYTLTLNNENMQDVTEGFLRYVRDHGDAVSADITANGETLDQSALALLGLTSTGLQELVNTVRQYSDDAELTALAQQMTESLQGTEIVSTIKKTGNQKYTETDRLRLAMTDPTTGISMNMGMELTMKIDGTKGGTFQVPADSDIASAAAIGETLPLQGVSATLYMDEQTLYLTKFYTASIFNTMEVVESQAIVRNNYNYFPLRQIAEMFGEQVAWDKNAEKAYVIRGTQKIDMTGFLQNGRTYVKLRDFEKLGYLIDYVNDPVLGGVATIQVTFDPAWSA